MWEPSTKNPRLQSRALFVGSLICLAAIIGAATFVGPTMTEAQQSSIQQSRPPQPSEQLITFQIRSTPVKSGGSKDLITIQFSNSSGEVRQAPKPLFDKDVLAEFSFSGLDAQDAAFSFQRVVRDTSFLNARFIRVINHGDNGWAGESISISLTDPSTNRLTRILDRQSLYPRRGYSREGGIQDFNRSNWAQRTYWEADFQKIRVR